MLGDNHKSYGILITMKIIETNSEQWEINESGIATVIIGSILAVGGVVGLVWTVTHLESVAWWWSLVGAGAALIGGLVIFSAAKRQLVLRRQGMSEVITTKLIGGKQTRSSFDASQIVSVNLDTIDTLKTATDRDGDQTTTRERSSLLYVLLRDNSQVMLASRKGGSNGITMNGINLNGISKAPLADEAQRIATFYGVPLSSRANNVSGAQAVASVVNTVQQGISGVQQPVQAQPAPVSTVPASAPVIATPPIEPVMVTEMGAVQQSAAPVQPTATESPALGEQSPRQM